MRRILNFLSLSLAVMFLVSPLQFAQLDYQNNKAVPVNELNILSTHKQINSMLALENSVKNLHSLNGNNLSLAKKRDGLRLNTNVAETQNLLPDDYIPW